jgi:hypothetical protein
MRCHAETDRPCTKFLERFMKEFPTLNAVFDQLGFAKALGGIAAASGGVYDNGGGVGHAAISLGLLSLEKGIPVAPIEALIVSSNEGFGG